MTDRFGLNSRISIPVALGRLLSSLSARSAVSGLWTGMAIVGGGYNAAIAASPAGMNTTMSGTGGAFPLGFE